VPFVAVSRSTALVAVSALLLVLVFAGQRLARTGTTAAPEVVAPLEPVSDVSARPTLVVHVVGAVRRPGLLRLREGARVADAVARAGGATRRADLAALNLAAPLVDGVQVLVPRRASTSGPSGSLEGDLAAPTGTESGVGPKPSLSSATADELDELPGVGPVTAQKILLCEGRSASVRDRMLKRFG
jgi:competence protein ComEA